MVVGENRVLCVWYRSAPVFLLACRGLSNLFSAKSFAGFFQKYPRYFEGVPLGYKKFVFDVLFDAARNVTKSCVKCLS